jgi:hypothetical protein
LTLRAELAFLAEVRVAVVGRGAAQTLLDGARHFSKFLHVKFEFRLNVAEFRPVNRNEHQTAADGHNGDARRHVGHNS